MKDQKAINFPSMAYLESVETFTPGLRVSEVVERYGVPADKVAKLASAENPIGPSPQAVKAIGLALNDLSLYPDWQARSVREAIARHNGVAIKNIIASCGETELILSIIMAFSEQADEIVFPIPTFPIYKQAALVERRQPVQVPMDQDFTIDPDKLLNAFTKKTRILILTSPNNPLSTTIEKEKLTYILDHTPPEVLVLLDEAYADYSETGPRTDLAHCYPNLILLRTFSKVYGLAGLRVGYGIAHEAIIRALMKVKPTWNIGNLAAAGAAAALDDKEHYKKTKTLIQTGRDYLVEKLSGFSDVSVVMKPEGNFICLQILDPAITSTDVFEGLLQGGVIIKDCSVSYKGLGNRFIRVDVNVRQKMDHFLSELSRVMG
jgi:histidinol-phosphate aminotransferase